MTLADDQKNPLELPPKKTEESNQTDLDGQSLEEFASFWPKDNTPEIESQWTKGDRVLEYIKSARAAGVYLLEAEILQLLANSVGEHKDSLRSYAWVADKFPSEKRHKDLSWSHHRAAAGSKDPEHWIKIALNEGQSEKLSVRELNDKIAKDLNEDKIKHYRNKKEYPCTFCSKMITKTEFNLYRGDVSVGNFCSYACLAAYAMKALEDKAVSRSAERTGAR